MKKGNKIKNDVRQKGEIEERGKDQKLRGMINERDKNEATEGSTKDKKEEQWEE